MTGQRDDGKVFIKKKKDIEAIRIVSFNKLFPKGGRQ